MISSGTCASSERLMVMSSGKMRDLSWPILGCSPRPRKRPGGSTRKLPSFSLRPSTTAKAKGSSRRSRSALAAFFWSEVMAFLIALWLGLGLGLGLGHGLLDRALLLEVGGG